MSITIRFTCGHVVAVSDDAKSPPVCGCGERAVASVKARAPRFVGACVGPYAETKVLPPETVDLAPGGPLRLKES